MCVSVLLVSWGFVVGFVGSFGFVGALKMATP